MVDENQPQHPEDENQGNKKAEHIPAIEQHVGAPLRDLTGELASLRDEIKADNQKTQRDYREYQHKQLYWTRFSAFSTTALSCIALTISAITLAVLHQTRMVIDKQREVTQSQLQEMRNSSSDTKVLAHAAKTQAENTEKLRFAAEKQLEQLEANVKAAQQSADAAKSSVEIANQALKFNNTSFRMTMRPYVAAKAVDIIEFVPGKPFTFRLRVENTGRTPGVDLTLYGRSHFGTKPLPLNMGLRKSTLTHSLSIIGSGVIQGSTGKTDSVTEQRVYDLILKGNITIFAEGEITYRDVFANETSVGSVPPYKTRYCFRYNLVHKAMTFCSINNLMK